jgi:hypothetical protein
MSYAPHRPDLIRAKVGPLGNLTLFRLIGGLEWKREVGPNDPISPMEMAVVLGVHRVTAHGWVSAGAIPSHSSPHGSLIRWRDVQAFARANGLPKKQRQ